MFIGGFLRLRLVNHGMRKAEKARESKKNKHLLRWNDLIYSILGWVYFRRGMNNEI
jgi:hypothetical protein